MPASLERLSIELSNRCGKACWFCYNASGPDGATSWDEGAVVDFVTDCARHDVRAVSFGGGEPLQHPAWSAILRRLDGVLFRSLTTNGLPLDPATVDELVAARPDKVHISIHFPERTAEVERVGRQVAELAERGLVSGVNLLVARPQLAAATRARVRLHELGIGNERIVFLPMRGPGANTPTPRELAAVAGGPFQSMTCLTGCAASPRFASVGWDRQVAWCSYTMARRPLGALTFAGLAAALDGLGLEFCGDSDDAPVRLSRRA